MTCYSIPYCIVFRSVCVTTARARKKKRVGQAKDLPGSSRFGAKVLYEPQKKGGRPGLSDCLQSSHLLAYSSSSISLKPPIVARSSLFLFCLLLGREGRRQAKKREEDISRQPGPRGCGQGHTRTPRGAFQHAFRPTGAGAGDARPLPGADRPSAGLFVRSVGRDGMGCPLERTATRLSWHAFPARPRVCRSPSIAPCFLLR